MNKEALIMKYKARINLLNSRNPEGNRGIIHKLERKIRKLKAE